MMMEQKPDQFFDNFLAQAAEPEEFGFDQNKSQNNPSRSIALGLAKLYEKYLIQIKRQQADGLIDENKANELIARVDNFSLSDLGFEISEGMPLELAREIMGPEMFFGPQEVAKVGIEIREEIPPIPFNSEELERAKELGQMLIYRTSTTMKELNDTFSPDSSTPNKGNVLYNFEGYENEKFYTSDMIQPGWALVSKDLTPGSTMKNYLQQSELLVEYLINEVFKGKPLPREYQAAVNHFNARKEFIRQLLAIGHDADNQSAGLMLIGSRINQLFRQSPAEVIYDGLVYFQNTGERLHAYDHVWTNAESLDGRLLIIVGTTNDEGADVDERSPVSISIQVGASFSRRGADLKS